MSIYLLFIGFLLLFFLSALFVIVKLGPLAVLQPPRITADDYRRCTNIISPADLDLSFKDVTVLTGDGTKLVGWFIAGSQPTRGTVIYLHGVGDNKISGLPIAKTFHEHGYNFSLFDSRRHGESGGRFCTYGYREKHDLSEIITTLENSYNAELGKIGVFGVSMGAAVAIQAAAIDSRIETVVAEGCFLDLRSISRDHQKRIIKIRWKFIGDLVMRRAERIADFKADAVSPLKALDETLIPILFVHGTSDSIIDHHYSEMLFEHARGPKKLYLIEDAYHNNTWDVGGKEYDRKLLGFFDRWLSSTSSTSS